MPFVDEEAVLSSQSALNPHFRLLAQYQLTERHTKEYNMESFSAKAIEISIRSWWGANGLKRVTKWSHQITIKLDLNLMHVTSVNLVCKGGNRLPMISHKIIICQYWFYCGSLLSQTGQSVSSGLKRSLTPPEHCTSVHGVSIIF